MDYLGKVHYYLLLLLQGVHVYMPKVPNKEIFESGRALTHSLGREREISFLFRKKRKSDMID